MTKRNTKSNAPVETASIVLKTMHNDILKSNPNATCTPKSMRVWLRANMRGIHDANASWTFTQSQYDIARSHFDPAYATKIARASKRNAKSPAPRKSRVVADNATGSSAVVTNNEMTPA